MVGLISLILIFLNFVTFYNDIKIELRNHHSRTFLRKNCKGILNKLFFVPFVREINKVKYSLMIINYILFLLGFIIQLLLSLNLIIDSNFVVVCLFKFMVVYSLTLFIYKMVINKILTAINENDSLAIKIILVSIFVYVIIFIVVPIYRHFSLIA